eukprot:TRINITY_DN17480_c0_g1_i1.p1 TRINITY_DN17480_c0_g1~~TRINITY_DN17480_c0_g1_i1.p1  ORF type:complete len:275 (+),score=61.35 TRINITY_DN17480_c0_g1_i1:104-928(+)
MASDVYAASAESLQSVSRHVSPRRGTSSCLSGSGPGTVRQCAAEWSPTPAPPAFSPAHVSRSRAPLKTPASAAEDAVNTSAAPSPAWSTIDSPTLDVSPAPPPVRTRVLARQRRRRRRSTVRSSGVLHRDALHRADDGRCPACGSPDRGRDVDAIAAVETGLEMCRSGAGSGETLQVCAALRATEARLRTALLHLGGADVQPWPGGREPTPPPEPPPPDPPQQLRASEHVLQAALHLAGGQRSVDSQLMALEAEFDTRRRALRAHLSGGVERRL